MTDPLPTATRALSEHSRLSDELAQVHRDLGQLRALRVTRYAETFMHRPELGITERREQATLSCADLDAEIAKAAAEVEALKVELAALTLTLTPHLSHLG